MWPVSNLGNLLKLVCTPWKLPGASMTTLPRALIEGKHVVRTHRFGSHEVVRCTAISDFKCAVHSTAKAIERFMTLSTTFALWYP